jgi:hypothetical protein
MTNYDGSIIKKAMSGYLKIDFKFEFRALIHGFM